MAETATGATTIASFASHVTLSKVGFTEAGTIALTECSMAGKNLEDLGVVLDKLPHIRVLNVNANRLSSLPVQKLASTRSLAVVTAAHNRINKLGDLVSHS
jgi:Leucine-rich repeat (LRR) protein